MLILTRRPNERIEIGDKQITVTVLEVHGGRVRLGIEAPSSVGIRRQEITRAPRSEIEFAEPLASAGQQF